MDIGATQDLIGQVALTALESVLRHVGLQVVEVDFNPTVPMGIGGMAEALKTILVPISPGGVPGVVEMTVLKNDIPPLLSVGLLDFLKAKIDLEKNTIHLKQIDVKLTMGRLTSGHRTIPLVQWNRASGTFPVPDEIQDKYGLGPNAFDLNHKTQSPSAYYTKEPSRVSFSLAVHEDFVHVTGDSVRVSSQPNALVEPNHSNDSVVIGNVQGFRECEFQEDDSNHEGHVRVSLGRSIHDDSNSSRVPKSMGSIGSRCPPKFELSTHSHGVSPQEDAAATMQRRGKSDHVDSLDDSSVHDDGKSPVEILSTGHCRVSNQECGFRKEEVCGAAGGGQQLLPSSSCQDSEASKSVCLLDGVWSLRKSTDLSNQESCSTTQEKVNSGSQSSPTDCTAVGSFAELGTSKCEGLFRGSGLRHSSQPDEFISSKLKQQCSHGADAAVRELHAESGPRSHSTTGTAGQQRGSGGYGSSRIGEGPKSDDLTVATDPGGPPGGCHYVSGSNACGHPNRALGADGNTNTYGGGGGGGRSG